MPELSPEAFRSSTYREAANDQASANFDRAARTASPRMARGLLNHSATERSSNGRVRKVAQRTALAAFLGIMGARALHVDAHPNDPEPQKIEQFVANPQNASDSEQQQTYDAYQYLEAHEQPVGQPIYEHVGPENPWQPNGDELRLNTYKAPGVFTIDFSGMQNPAIREAVSNGTAKVAIYLTPEDQQAGRAYIVQANSMVVQVTPSSDPDLYHMLESGNYYDIAIQATDAQNPSRNDQFASTDPNMGAHAPEAPDPSQSNPENQVITPKQSPGATVITPTQGSESTVVTPTPDRGVDPAAVASAAERAASSAANAASSEASVQNAAATAANSAARNATASLNNIFHKSSETPPPTPPPAEAKKAHDEDNDWIMPLLVGAGIMGAGVGLGALARGRRRESGPNIENSFNTTVLLENLMADNRVINFINLYQERTNGTGNLTPHELALYWLLGQMARNGGQAPININNSPTFQQAAFLGQVQRQEQTQSQPQQPQSPSSGDIGTSQGGDRGGVAGGGLGGGINISDFGKSEVHDSGNSKVEGSGNSTSTNQNGAAAQASAHGNHTELHQYFGQQEKQKTAEELAHEQKIQEDKEFEQYLRGVISGYDRKNSAGERVNEFEDYYMINRHKYSDRDISNEERLRLIRKDFDREIETRKNGTNKSPETGDSQPTADQIKSDPRFINWFHAKYTNVNLTNVTDESINLIYILYQKETGNSVSGGDHPGTETPGVVDTEAQNSADMRQADRAAREFRDNLRKLTDQAADRQTTTRSEVGQTIENINDATDTIYQMAIDGDEADFNTLLDTIKDGNTKDALIRYATEPLSAVDGQKEHKITAATLRWINGQKLSLASEDSGKQGRVSEVRSRLLRRFKQEWNGMDDLQRKNALALLVSPAGLKEIADLF